MRWEEMSKRQQGLVLALMSAEAALTITAVVDLAFGPKETVRGRRGLWWLGIFVQPVGPIVYLLWGRRRPRNRAKQPRKSRRTGPVEKGADRPRPQALLL